jgi:cell fate regulator YaaT (PSP1 superfamily)
MVACIPEYLVSHGKTGVLGRFIPVVLATYGRGERVVIQSDRGLSIGTVLCEATERQARILVSAANGKLLRRVQPEDEAAQKDCCALAERLYADSRELAMELHLAVEILDVELSLDGSRAILQCLAAANCDPTALLDQLAARHGIQVWLENLTGAKSDEEEEHAGCGKPDCGRTEGGGCSTCGTGGSCTSCGSGKVDMKDYFAHLRDKMDGKPRTPLL